MNDITILGIDLAKQVFHIYGYDKEKRTVINRRMSRKGLAEYIQKLKPCLIGMEACGGAHYWGRLFREMGHQIKLVAPQYVKAFVRGNKTDHGDARAIAECVSLPEMRQVAIKTQRQQEIQALHRFRERLVRGRVALSNELRGILLEFGFAIPTGFKNLSDALLKISSDAENGFGYEIREMLIAGLGELRKLTEDIRKYEQILKAISDELEVCQRLKKIDGVGPLTATAIVAHIGDAKVFKNGREMAAYLGLVPRQKSSGGKTVLLGISKRGDRTIRKLLIHGARSVIRFSEGRKDRLRQWVQRIDRERGRNKACVALANKNARMIWALMARGEEYRVHQAR
jgi:transposase